jgi:hypothetical protein
VAEASGPDTLYGRPPAAIRVFPCAHQGLDAALVDLADGARSVESQTHLHTSVRTFNTLESVAMIDLCPSEQRMIPAAVRSRLHQLAKSPTRQLAKSLKNSSDSPKSASG